MHIVNFLVLIAKQYLHRTRCAKKRPNIFEFKELVTQVRKKEKYNAIKNDKTDRFFIKWYGVNIQSNNESSTQDFINNYIAQMDA